MSSAILWISIAVVIGLMLWSWSKRSERPSSMINFNQSPINPAQPSSFNSAKLDQAQIQVLLSQGKKLEAIKQVRLQTSLGLKEAKDYVEAIERGLSPISPVVVEPTVQQLPEDLMREAQIIAQQGNKIKAIKLVRQATNLSLKEAKDMVDSW
ncbi:ribosomal protein L7/L12 [Herpetosiphon gulosus]|uniref:Large ribosomal subunit protein bL12 C-terminal domain-containing protein n=1 Tax=Herpetosiphon gulosus TaxID=1973496 RepID=A0ABP9X5M8_9CHLR